MPPTETFILRLVGPHQAEPMVPKLQGSVEHVRSGLRTTFATEETLVAFLRRCLEGNGREPG